MSAARRGAANRDVPDQRCPLGSAARTSTVTTMNNIVHLVASHETPQVSPAPFRAGDRPFAGLDLMGHQCLIAPSSAWWTRLVTATISPLGVELSHAGRRDIEQGVSGTRDSPRSGSDGHCAQYGAVYVADLDEDNASRVTPVELMAVRSGRQGLGGPAREFVARESALQRV